MLKANDKVVVNERVYTVVGIQFTIFGSYDVILKDSKGIFMATLDDISYKIKEEPVCLC